MCFLALFESPFKLKGLEVFQSQETETCFELKSCFKIDFCVLLPRYPFFTKDQQAFLWGNGRHVFCRGEFKFRLPFLTHGRVHIQCTDTLDIFFLVLVWSFYSGFYSTFSNIAVNEIIVTLSQLLASNIRLMHQVLLLDARWVRSCTLSLIIIIHYRFSLSFLSL